jgi:glucose-1-phosphate thymidylyltransferase
VTTTAPRALIAAGGVGRRLGAHTRRRPKPLIYVAGRPILAHLLDALPSVGITDVVVVVGYLREQIQAFLASRPGPPARVVVQERALGNGHAVYAAREWLRGPVLIQFGDTIPKLDLSGLTARRTASIGVSEVDDPSGYGIVETDARGRARRLWEKPERAPSNRAVVGTFFFPEASALAEALGALIGAGVPRDGEFWLTDAVQLMIERGGEVDTFPVERFYDCGTVDRVLLANRELLDSSAPTPTFPATEIVRPCAIDSTAAIRDSRIGPYVTVAPGARIARARVRDAVVHPEAVLEDVDVAGAIIDGP